MPCLHVGPRGIIGRVDGERRVASATGPVRGDRRTTGVVVRPPTEAELADETDEPIRGNVEDGTDGREAENTADSRADGIVGRDAEALEASDQAAPVDGDESTATGGATEERNASR